MTAAWRQSGGDLATVLDAMTATPAYAASLGHAFKDPVHYVVSAVRYAYGSAADGNVVVNVDPMINWLKRMGEGLYDHQTPDGYPLGASAWTGPGQMEVRFEIAKAIGNGSAGLLRPRDPAVAYQPSAPDLRNALWSGGVDRATTGQTRAVLDQAASPQEWNMLFLASPDFMRR